MPSPSLHPPSSLAPDLRSKWMLDPRITFLNHGSFGAVPRAVFDEQNRWRQRIEAEPIEILGRRFGELIDAAKIPVGQWLGMAPEDFGFITNATEGVNAVLRSVEFKPGDELLTTTHVYHAVRQAMRYAAQRTGADYREIDIPLPLSSAGQIKRTVVNSLSNRTRLLVIDHITSPTAAIFPVGQIVAACAQRGIDVMIDGAHAPGMVELNVPALGAAYYAGNLHKWTCGPKGSAFLWVRPDRRAAIHPLVVSHYQGEGLAREFGWQGTRDISSWLTVPSAIDFMAAFGWKSVMAHNRAMAAWVNQMLCQKWRVESISPTDGSLLGSMATVPLPPPLDRLDASHILPLQRKLYDDHQIEIPLMNWAGRMFARPCCQIYNIPADYQRLAEVILQIAKTA